MSRLFYRVDGGIVIEHRCDSDAHRVDAGALGIDIPFVGFVPTQGAPGTWIAVDDPAQLPRMGDPAP